jgi:hypothetical protein
MSSGKRTRRRPVWFQIKEYAQWAGVPPCRSLIFALSTAEESSMRNTGLGISLALVASLQLTLFSGPAFAENASNGPEAVPVQTTSGQPRAVERTPRPGDRRNGWVVLGIATGITVAGVVLEIVGATQGTVAGAGGAGDDGSTSNSRTNFIFGGTALILAGVVTGIVGGSMVAASYKTVPEAETAGGSDGVTRTLQAAYQTAPAFNVPVLGATF